MTEPPSRPNSTIVPAPSAALTERRAKLVSRGLREAASLQVGQLNAELIERFFDRVKSNDTAAVAKMLLQGPSLVSSREAALGRTALHYAAALANLGMATLLLDCGAPVLAKDSTGYSPLLDAIESSPTGRKVAMLLLDRGADPNEPSDTGVFPFFAAAMNNDGEMVQRLLQCGLDPHTRTKNNQSLLLQAAFLSCEPAARLLLDAGLDPNARDNNGNTAIHLACKSTWPPAHRLERPMRKGIFPTSGLVDSVPELPRGPQENFAGYFQRIERAGYSLRGSQRESLAILRRDFAGFGLVGLLIDRGAGVNPVDEGGETPLHKAARSGKRAAAGVLLAHGAEPHRRNRKGQTAADVAEEGHMDPLARWLRTL